MPPNILCSVTGSPARTWRTRHEFFVGHAVPSLSSAEIAAFGRRGANDIEVGETALSTVEPAIILVEPQLGENIGAAARAMMNCGLDELRLVAPRDGWPQDGARNAASGADAVLDAAKVFETTEAAVVDLERVFATTARPRDMRKKIMTPRAAAPEMLAATARGERVGVLFGRERSGLDNDDVALADTVIEAPLNPAHTSLNLAQAVLIVAYDWWIAATGPRPARLARRGSRHARKEELIGLFEHLEGELDDAGFLYPPEKRPGMVRSLRNMLQRAALSEQEVRTLRGVVASLSRRRKG